jgi:hypothetical protein
MRAIAPPMLWSLIWLPKAPQLFLLKLFLNHLYRPFFIIRVKCGIRGEVRSTCA